MADRDVPTPEWDRWDRLWHGVFFVALAVPALVALSRAGEPAGSRLLTAATAAGFALWHWLLPLRHPEWVQRSRPLTVYLTGAACFTYVLVGRDPAFTFLVYALYPQMFVLLGRWGVVGAVGVTLLVFPRAGVFGPGLSFEALLSIGGSAALAVTLGLFISAIAAQSARRQEALEALAAARSNLAEASRRAGVLEERQRLASEIHDTVAQGLSSIVMLLEAAEHELPAGTPVVHDHLAKARLSAREGLADLRRSVLALRPDVLEHASLPGALALVVERWSERAGIAATARVLGEPYPLDTDTEVALLRTAQEALANVAKHAAALEVTVTLTFGERETTLDIRDDGHGFDPRAAGSRASSSGGFGLPGLRQRLARVDGRLAVDSRPDAGTVVVAAVPRLARTGG